MNATASKAAEALIDSLKTPLTIDAGGTIHDADGVLVHVPPLLGAHLVVALANRLATAKAAS